MDCRYGSHRVFKFEYRFVWVTKYRHTVLTGDEGERVRERSGRSALRSRSGF
mgnify:CR=1 FL=1